MVIARALGAREKFDIFGEILRLFDWKLKNLNKNIRLQREEKNWDFLAKKSIFASQKWYFFQISGGGLQPLAPLPSYATVQHQAYR